MAEKTFLTMNYFGKMNGNYLILGRLKLGFEPVSNSCHSLKEDEYYIFKKNIKNIIFLKRVPRGIHILGKHKLLVSHLKP